MASKSLAQLEKEIKELEKKKKEETKRKELEARLKRLKSPGRGKIASALDRAGEAFWGD